MVKADRSNVTPLRTLNIIEPIAQTNLKNRKLSTNSSGKYSARSKNELENKVYSTINDRKGSEV